MPIRTAPFRSVRRRGFTLVELMLVLAIIGVIAGLSWPVLKSTFELARLKSGAEQVQSAFGHAKVDAMNKGLPQVFHFEPGTGQYCTEVWQDDLASTEGDASTSGSTSSTAGSAAPASSSTTGGTASSNSSSAVVMHQLPEGIVFADQSQVQDARADALAAEGEAPPSSSSGGSSAPIMFYADGTASEASVTVTSPSGRSISISLRGFTGVSRLSDVFTGSAPNGAPGGTP
jgi:prepilin-type N-terminal cleavage/methylation domain-containing protein